MIKVKNQTLFFLNTNFFIVLRNVTLRKTKVKSLVRWTKNTNVFNKKLIFIPIHKEPQHWSLCVVVNPGKFTKKDKVNEYDDEILYIFVI